MLRRTPRRSALLPIRPEVGVDLEGAAVRVTQPIGGLEGQADVASVAPLLEDVRQADQLELVATPSPGASSSRCPSPPWSRRTLAAVPLARSRGSIRPSVGSSTSRSPAGQRPGDRTSAAS